MKLGISGHYRIEKREVGSNKLKCVMEFDNLITNRGLDGYGRGVATTRYCYIGRGTNAPDVNDRTLGSYVGAAYISSHSTSGAVAPDYVSSSTNVYRFNAGQVTGNFTEIGIGNAGGNPVNDYLFSRALILDEHGNPSVITVLPNEYLDIYYTIYFHPPLTQEVDFGITILGTTHHVIGKMAQASGSSIDTNYDGLFCVQDATIQGVYKNCTALGDITGNVNGIETDKSASGYPYHPRGSRAAYADGTYKIASTFHFGLGNDNYEEGISGLLFETGASRANNTLRMYSQYLIDPPIPKSNKRELDLTFEWSWGRHGG